MTVNEIVEELRTLGSASIRKVLRNHGVQEPFFGVKIGDMKKIQKRIKKDYQPDSVRYAINGFVIALGTYVRGMNDQAAQAAAKIGQVSVDMGDTACKVPDALEYIQRARGKAATGKKRKTVKC